MNKIVTTTTTRPSTNGNKNRPRNRPRRSRGRKQHPSARPAPPPTMVVRETKVVDKGGASRGGNAKRHAPKTKNARPKHVRGHHLGTAGSHPVSISAALEPPNPIFVAVVSDLFRAKSTLEKKGLSLSHALPRGLQGGRVVPFIWHSRGTIVAPPQTNVSSEWGAFGVTMSPYFTAPLTALTYGASVAPTLTGATFASNIASVASLSNSAYMFGVAVKFTCLDNFTTMTGQVTGGRFYPLVLNSGVPGIASTMSQTACFSCSHTVQMALPAEKTFGAIITPERITFDMSTASSGNANARVHQTYERFPWLTFAAAPTDSIGWVYTTANILYRYNTAPLWTFLFDGVPGSSKWDIEIACFGAYKTGNEGLVRGDDMETQHPISHSFVGTVEHDVAAVAEGVLHTVGAGIKDVGEIGEAITDVGEFVPGLAAGAKIGNGLSSAAAKVGSWIESHTS